MALLAATRRLIEATGGTDFTMQQLADEAGTSLATTYNVIGTKAAVLYALLDTCLDELSRRQQAIAAEESGELLLPMVDLAVGFFATEPGLFRPLMRYLLGVFEPAKRPLFMSRALRFWEEATRTAAPDDDQALMRQDLALGLHLAFTGALDLWVHEEIGPGEFIRHMSRQAAILRRGATPATAWR